MSAARVTGWALVAVLLAGEGAAAAKELKYSTPGRAIYSSQETFGEALDQTRRQFVIEVVVGSAPEGNLGVTLGWLGNKPEGLELYAGFGTRTGPVLHHTLAVRYFLPFVRYRGYLGSGYVFQRHTKLDLWSQ